jgi:hypothetical protein
LEALKARPLLHPRYGIFEPEPSRWEASETDGQVQRPTERERRSQHVEISVESPAVAAHPLRVALEQLFVAKALKEITKLSRAFVLTTSYNPA